MADEEAASRPLIVEDFERVSSAVSIKCDRALVALGGIVLENGGMKLLQFDAMLGNATAQASLASLIYHGLYIEKDEARGLKLLELAVAKGNSDAQFYLGAILYYEKNEARGLELLKLAADSGNADAQSCLEGELDYSAEEESPVQQAMCLYHGDGIEKNEEAGLKLLELAVGKGDVMAQYFLGIILHYEKNEARGLELLQLAADSGSSDAQGHLGLLLYSGGCGVEKNEAKGLELLQRGADGGDILAQYTLCDFLLYERGMKRRRSRLFLGLKKPWLADIAG